MRRNRFYLSVAHKDALNLAFKLMRQHGLIARQNFSCCGGCAGYEIATQVAEMSIEERAKVKGTVFYHRQDAANLRDEGECYLAYGQLELKEHGPIGLPTVEVGQLVAQCLTDAEVPFEWDGNPDTRIFVTFAPKPVPVPETTPMEHFLQNLVEGK